MNNNFLGIRGLYKTHVDGLKPFNSKSVTYTYIGYTEHNSRGQPIVCRTGHWPKQRQISRKRALIPTHLVQYDPGKITLGLIALVGTTFRFRTRDLT